MEGRYGVDQVRFDGWCNGGLGQQRDDGGCRVTMRKK